LVSMIGEYSGKTRSTPLPKLLLRTVKLEPTPLFERAMHTPSNACTRVRSPSITLTPTRSVSPGRNSGTGLSLVSASIASRSRVSIRFIGLLPSYFVAARQRAVPAIRPRGARSGPAAIAVYLRPLVRVATPRSSHDPPTAALRGSCALPKQQAGYSADIPGDLARSSPPLRWRPRPLPRGAALRKHRG